VMKDMGIETASIFSSGTQSTLFTLLSRKQKVFLA